MKFVNRYGITRVKKIITLWDSNGCKNFTVTIMKFSSVTHTFFGIYPICKILPRQQKAAIYLKMITAITLAFLVKAMLILAVNNS